MHKNVEQYQIISNIKHDKNSVLSISDSLEDQKYETLELWVFILFYSWHGGVCVCV